MTTDDYGKLTHIWHLFGYEVFDSGGERVGLVDKVWTDGTTSTLRFIGVRSGRLSRKTHIIPAGGAHIDEAARSIRVAYLAAQIRGAPSHNMYASLNDEQEGKVSSHYANL